MKQRSFASLSFDTKKKRTRRQDFLSEMEKVVPWAKLLTLIEPHYPTEGRPGRQPIPCATMLRICLMQNWYALSDPAMEDALYEIESMRRFAGIELNENAIPDETTILKFRRLLEQHHLTASMLEGVNHHLSQHGLTKIKTWSFVARSADGCQWPERRDGGKAMRSSHSTRLATPDKACARRRMPRLRSRRTSRQLPRKVRRRFF